MHSLLKDGGFLFVVVVVTTVRWKHVAHHFCYSYQPIWIKHRAELQPEADANQEVYFWLQMKPKEKDKEDERKTLVGSFQRDVALWFSLASIGAAWLPQSSVSHRDVMHAYAICFFWTVLHHSCRQATTWSAG